MSSQLLSCLLGLAALLPAAGCQLPELQHEARIVAKYSVEVRCRTRDGSPIAKVLIINLNSGVKGYTDAQGRISFEVEAIEGAVAAFRVERTPDGIVELDGSPEHRVILKSIVGARPDRADKPGQLRYDILMRRLREEYVVLVSTRGVADLPVIANGVPIGRLNRLGAGLFRVFGEPGEELKLTIQTAGRPALSQDNPERIFTLPWTGGILSFASTLTPLPEAAAKRPENALATLTPKKRKHHHHARRAHHTAKPSAPTFTVPVQVPYRDIEVK